MTTLEITGTADRVAADIRATGGSTHSVVAGVLAPTAGYMVSLRGYEHVQPLDRATLTQTVAKYIDGHRDALAQPGRYVGAWVDGGALYLDVSVNVASLDSALVLGRQHGQLAVWDVAAGQEIRLDRVEPFAA